MWLIRSSKRVKLDCRRRYRTKQKTVSRVRWCEKNGWEAARGGIVAGIVSGKFEGVRVTYRRARRMFGSWDIRVLVFFL